MDFLLDPNIWIAFSMLTALEIVLGVDNIIFISILVGRLPTDVRDKARRLGLGFAMLSRLALLFSLSWVMGLKADLFHVFGQGISGRDLVLLGGGLFLLWKASHEIFVEVEAREQDGPPAADPAALKAAGTTPCLAVLLVGEDPASAVYVRNKVNACEKAGVKSIKDTYAADVDPAVVMARIAELNADPSVHGILVQLPLPKHFDEKAVLEAISVEKDVDGFHAENVGRLSQGQEAFVPCTPNGVMEMLKSIDMPLRGAEAVVIGRSNIVGKPMAMLLTAAGATVTVCHSGTRDLNFHTRRADILVAAIGKPKFVTGDMIKPGAVVIDVGINRLSDGPNAGKLCGDVDFDSAKEVAGAITPVPGGVGPMTITMLLANTVESATRAARKA